MTAWPRSRLRWSLPANAPGAITTIKFLIEIQTLTSLHPWISERYPTRTTVSKTQRAPSLRKTFGHFIGAQATTLHIRGYRDRRFVHSESGPLPSDAPHRITIFCREFYSSRKSFWLPCQTRSNESPIPPRAIVKSPTDFAYSPNPQSMSLYEDANPHTLTRSPQLEKWALK